MLRSHGNSLSWRPGLGMGRLGPLSQPHIPSGLSLATSTLTNSQCCPPFWILRFLTFLLLVWPLRIMDLNSALLTSLILYSLSQMPRRVTRMDVWVAQRTIPGASFMIVMGMVPQSHAMWLPVLPGRKLCLTQPCIPGRRKATLIKIRGLTHSYLLPNILCMGFARHKATMPNGLKRNP